jgi:hypothetical protein
VRPVRRALRKNLDVVETDSGYLLVSSACREVGRDRLGALRKMGSGWEWKPRARSSRAAQLKSARSAGRCEHGRDGGAAAAGEATAGGGSAPLGAPDLLPDPAHGGAHAVVEGSHADSQVCSRLLLRARLRGAPVTGLLCFCVRLRAVSLTFVLRCSFARVVTLFLDQLRVSRSACVVVLRTVLRAS